MIKPRARARDSLLKIKRDFIVGMFESSSPTGRRFLPRLREVKGDPEEKERVKVFLEANIRAYQLIVDYVTLLFDTF